MTRPTLEAPTAAASEERKVRGRPLAVGVLGSYGWSADRSVILPGSVSALGSGTRQDARVRPGVSNECGSLLPIWRDTVRLLSVNAAAYEPVLGALSVNATVCESMGLVAALDSALQRKCGGDVVYLVSVVGSCFFTPYIDVTRVRYWFGKIKSFPRYRVCYRSFSLAPRSTWRRAVICK